MSSSAISAAKRRTEIALKNYKIPTTSERSDQYDSKNHQILLSLLQSRINWSTNVFVKYRPDPQQQPKRNPVIRRRYPKMRELGQATLALGPHFFYETSFYEAIRSDSWVTLGKAANVEGIDQYEKSLNQDDNQRDATTNGTAPSNRDADEIIAPKLPTDTDTDMNDKTVNGTTLDQTTDENTTAIIEDEGKTSQDQVTTTDIVIEFKDQPSERYLFPKDIIMQVLEDSSSAICSFMLPLDRTDADCFFWNAKQKIDYFGDQSTIPEIQKMAAKKDVPASPISTTNLKEQDHQPVNIRLLDASSTIINAIQSTVHPPEIVREKLIKKMQKVPTRTYLDYNISKTEQQSMGDLIQRVHTQPDIISGPIAAEKKRNEIGLAIKLGKRPESDQHEAEPPKTKQHIPGKEDEFRKCVYCSTRHTVMWRHGPAGEGTLCNGCGILWLQGKILKGAPVITKEEEKQRIRERWQNECRRREQEEWVSKQRRIKEEKEAALREEQEAAHRMEICMRIKKKRALASQKSTLSSADLSPSLPPSTESSQSTTLPMSSEDSLVSPSSSSSTAIAPASSTTSSSTAPSYHIFNLPQIPLPTLSIEFTHTMFSHPNCTVSLSHQKHFSVQLTKGDSSIHLNIPKQALANAKFEILGQVDSAGRDILLMSCQPDDVGLGQDTPLDAFDEILYNPRDDQRKMNIRFLEKIDASGGPVVKKILECWLATDK
ncbi:uncharacterized protein BX664DRAFT_258642 [Halteromyces radiatus]|uniref:uncharacterized protein n=1 Tax=Halteromyces radiatus TaxID=101107 RepID=UPI002220B770|nr:uncharacterized protein BX664DRAFT_258642 [Halteromyces radiatus]KAI8096466.1 hypothetical protein BX664DRAFT_258642 [Halteromyces radiatus]